VRSGGVNGEYIDYEREFYGQNGFINETSITARGGSATTLFTLSGQARNDQGIIRNTFYNRYAVRGFQYLSDRKPEFKFHCKRGR
jgi:hypothetical protein